MPQPHPPSKRRSPQPLPRPAPALPQLTHPRPAGPRRSGAERAAPQRGAEESGRTRDSNSGTAPALPGPTLYRIESGRSRRASRPITACACLPGRARRRPLAGRCPLPPPPPPLRITGPGTDPRSTGSRAESGPGCLFTEPQHQTASGQGSGPVPRAGGLPAEQPHQLGPEVALGLVPGTPWQRLLPPTAPALLRGLGATPWELG